MNSNSKIHTRIVFLTRTAVLIALLIALQWVTGFTQAFAGQYITGSLVNCVLAVAALFGGIWSGVIAACISPFCAFLLGVGPKLIQIVPCIALGNLTFVVLLNVLNRKGNCSGYKAYALGAAAVGKFIVLFVAVVKVVIPALADVLKPAQVATFTTMFSWPQMVTAVIGGGLAYLILPVIKKALQK